MTFKHTRLALAKATSKAVHSSAFARTLEVNLSSQCCIIVYHPLNANITLCNGQLAVLVVSFAEQFSANRTERIRIITLPYPTISVCISGSSIWRDMAASSGRTITVRQPIITTGRLGYRHTAVFINNLIRQLTSR